METPEQQQIPLPNRPTQSLDGTWEGNDEADEVKEEGTLIERSIELSFISAQLVQQTLRVCVVQAPLRK